MNTLARRLLAAATAALIALSPISAAFAADNTTGKDASGATINLRCKDTGSAILACMAVLGDSSGAIIDPATAGNQASANTKLDTLHTDLTPLATAANQTPAYAATLTTTITRPANTTAYTVNTALADSTSAPTAGGFTLTSACRTSGGSGMMLSLSVISSNDPATLLQGEVWVFDSAPTAINDNASFSISDSDILKLVPGGVIPFVLGSTNNGSGTNSAYTVTGLNLAYTCSGTANLRFFIKVRNGYTPASGETLTLRAAVTGLN